MHAEFAGTVWLVVVAGGAAALAVALIVASAVWLARDRGKDAETERATREEYDEAEQEEARQDRNESVN